MKPTRRLWVSPRHVTILAVKIERERVNHQTWGYDGDLMTVIKMGLKGCLMGIS